MGDYQKALEYCKKSIDIRVSLKETKEIFYPLTSIAEIYLKIGDYNQSLLYLNQAQKLAEELNQKKQIMESYFLIHEVFSQSGDYQKSLEYHKLFTNLKDSLSTEEMNKKFAEASVKMETEAKERENKLLKESKQVQQYYFIVISGLFLILILVILNRYFNKNKANKLLNEKNLQIKNQHHKLEDMFVELQKKEENLSDANATKDKFFSIIAHDLKNPLHSITLSSDLLINKYKQMSGEQLLDLINSIYKSGQHLSSLLENLLQWSRAQSGKMEFDPIHFDIRELSVENISLLLGNAIKKKITIENNIPDATYVFGDPNMISTVIRNLISNAIKFTNEHGQVKITSKDDKGMIEISVTDNGVGIEDEDLKKLFRIDIHHTTIGTLREKGTGLGLILAKEFIDIHGGKIWVKRNSEIGSTFIFTLPKEAPKSIPSQFMKEYTLNNSRYHVNNLN
ncbi:MAG: tetratricopeptide repeat-containing sensor histidine kinase [Bacteroidetes bacterium]|nr:tetratricopeptide repeat-containing sensor histidine kinase [Bacteroidota bacterium]